MKRFAALTALVAVTTLVRTPAAMADWAQTFVAAPPSGTAWELSGVSCTAPATCQAVGTYDDASNVTHLLAERRSSSGWTLAPISERSGATSPGLASVSCTSVGDCVAVGDDDEGGVTVTLAELWTGSSWSPVASPNPTGATASRLQSVSCTAATACTAVGTATLSGVQTGFVERWNGTGWQLQTPATPTGATATALNGVECTSATSCEAVGSYSTGTGTLTLAEHWNGATWSIQTTPNPSSSTFSELQAVSCTSAAACTATGAGFAERFDGVSWTLQTLALPHAGDPAELTGVSCTSATSCVGVGNYALDAVITEVAETWNGTAWKVQPTSLSTSGDSSFLQNVSCRSATACTAVGQYHNDGPTPGPRGLVQVLALRWQDEFATIASGTITSAFDAVSCAGVKACAAVGSVDTTGSSDAYAQIWDGTFWTDFVPAANAILAGVSCTGASACTAVGDLNVDPQGRHLVALAERWNGTSWTSQPISNPVGAVNTFLTAVSCRTATFCTAAGFYQKAGGKEFALIESWNGTAWTVHTPPNPTGATSTQLLGIACGSVTACVAVGSAAFPGHGDLVTEAWNGTIWALRPAANPDGGATGALNGVACSAAAACTAVGSYTHSAATTPLALRWNGTSWTAQTAAPGGGLGSNLNGVSCAGATDCIAVGTTARLHAGVTPLAEHWDGSVWKLHNPFNPAGSHQTFFHGVSCPSVVVCMGVGSSQDSVRNDQVLAERYG